MSSSYPYGATDPSIYDLDPGYEDCDDDTRDADCQHDEYEVSWEGRATCDRCHHSWWLTSEQFQEHQRFMAECAESYDRYIRRNEHWFWRRLDALKGWVWRLLHTQKPRAAAIDTDDEIPF